MIKFRSNWDGLTVLQSLRVVAVSDPTTCYWTRCFPSVLYEAWAIVLSG